MASELVKVVRCDVCGAEGATEYGSVRAGGEPRDIDLCGAHEEPLAALERFIAEHGRPVYREATGRTGPRPRANDHRHRPAILGKSEELRPEFRTCPECRYVTPTRSSLSVHMSAHHGTALREAEERLAVRYTCPAGDHKGTFASLAAHASRSGHSLT